MSVQYSAVKWNQNKRVYDATIGLAVFGYLALFFSVGKLVWAGPQSMSDEVLLIRALGTCAIVMLHVVLCIGPLARLDRRFSPVLYNRRHLGVATFLVGLAHGGIAAGYYHGFGQLNPFVSLLSSNQSFDSLAAFPFEVLGLAALVILFLLAATSHDFWQKNLGPSVWKGLHMLVYPAYGLLVWHVCLGALQAERSWLYPALFAAGITTVAGLHLATGWQERRRDAIDVQRCSAPAHASVTKHPTGYAESDGWIDVGAVEEIENYRARTVCLARSERVAIFRYDGRISAVTNVCAHQRGPLGEGKIVDGCITCPWHGWEYRPQDGRSPPPFQERIATFRVRVEHGRILLNPIPLPPGTPVEPAFIEEPIHV